MNLSHNFAIELFCRFAIKVLCILGDKYIYVLLVFPAQAKPALGAASVHYREKSEIAAYKRGTGGRSSFSGNVVTVLGVSGFLGKYIVNRLGKRMDISNSVNLYNFHFSLWIFLIQ